MEPRFETLVEKKLIGLRMTMSLANNRTRDLWQSFMARRNEIRNRVGTALYSLQTFDKDYFSNFNPNAQFEKWAAAEVSTFDEIPPEMLSLELPGGLYAVFFHKGAALTARQTFQFIYGTWIPQSKYSLDNRPHFEVLGAKYKNDDPNSEEEIWIPIK